MRKGFGKYRLVYGHLWKTYGQYWGVRISYFLQVLTRLCKLVALPVAISLIISRLSTQDYTGARDAVLIYVAFSLTLGILTTAVKYIGMRGENLAYEKITGDYFAKLVQADLDYFNSNLSGYLTTATRQYVDACMGLVRRLRDRYMNTVLSVVFPLAVIIWIDSWLGAVAVALSVVLGIYLFWASHVVGPYRTKSREIYKFNSGRMADIISNILAVRSTAQEDAYIKQVKQEAHTEVMIFHKRYILQSKMIGIREAITVITFMILLWLTVDRMSSGHIGIGAAVLVVTYTTTILTGIYTMSDDVDEHDDLVDKIIPAFEILNRKNTIADPAKPKRFTNIKGSIELKDVFFAYEDGRSVLSGFSLQIPAGQKVGVVGLSGAGKSTLTKLLLRFNDVDEGQVLIDGIDVRKIRQHDLRTNIAYVPQEPLLFHTSIKDNVLVAQPDASAAAIKKALDTAHASQFVGHLAHGVDSIVGERGVKLSGGQKQRIAIARAVLKDSPIIVLDEATSALDSESEQIIKDSFGEILKGKTALVVAHRLSTLSEMDRIIVIEDGKLVEDGTHKQLVAHRGVYAKLWQRQLRHTDE